jgi:hypothetical protein
MANLFVDNTLLGSGTVTVSSGNNTTINVTGVVFAGGAASTADFLNCGIEVTLAASPSTAAKQWKIITVAGNVLTVDVAQTLDGTPVAGTTYKIIRGCNVNNLAGQQATPGTANTGPVATLQKAYNLTNDNTSTIWVRYTGRDYDEAQRSTRATVDSGALIFSTTRSFILQGYLSLDGSNLPIPFTQAPSPIYATKINGERYLLTSAAEQLDTSLIPMIRPVTRDLPSEIRFGTSFSGFQATTVQFRFLQFDVPGNLKMIQFLSALAANTYTLSFDRCVLGTGLNRVTTGQVGFYDDSTQGGALDGGQTKTFEFLTCRLLGTQGGAYIACAAALVMEDCYVKFTGNSAGPNGGSGANSDAGHGIYIVSESNTGAANNPVRCLKRARIRRTKVDLTSLGLSVNLGSTNGCIHGADRSANESSLTEFGLEYTDHFEVTDCRLISTNSLGHPLYQKGCPSVHWERNHVTADRYNAAGLGGLTGSATCIRVDPGANVTFVPAYARYRTLLRGKVSAQSAVNTVLFTASGIGTIDTTANAYKNRLVRVTLVDGSVSSVRMISASASAAGTTTLTHVSSATPTSYGHSDWNDTVLHGGLAVLPGTAGALDRYEVLEEIFNQSIINYNWCEHLKTTGQNGRGIQIGIGADATECVGNICLKGDIGIWCMANHCTIAFNGCYAGQALLVKGGSWNRVFNNTLVMAGLASADKNVISLMDVSAYDDAQTRHWQHYSKCMGNSFHGNIIANIGQAGTDTVFGYCIFESLQGDAKFAGAQPTWRPAGQHNHFDFNLYWRDDNADGTSDVDATHALMRLNAANRTALSDVQALWASGGAPYSSYFSLNEAHSQYGNPQLADPANGDFRLKSTSPAIGAGPAGGTVGASAIAVVTFASSVATSGELEVSASLAQNDDSTGRWSLPGPGLKQALSVSGFRAIDVERTAGTAEAAVDLGDIGTLGYVMVRHTGPTGTITFRTSAGLAVTDAHKLLAGDVALFRAATPTWFVQSDVAGVPYRIRAVED